MDSGLVLTDAEHKYFKQNPGISLLIKNLISQLIAENVKDIKDVFRISEGLKRRHSISTPIVELEGDSSSSTSSKKNSISSSSTNKDEDDDNDNMDTNAGEDTPGIEPEPEPENLPRMVSSNRRRGAISSEPVASDDLEEKLTINKGTPKTIETQKQLEESVKNNLLFVHLEPEERNEVFSAMAKIEVNAGDLIIRQGDEGDYFYVVDSGNCEVWKQENPSEPAKCVMKVRQWDSFGELALIYNTPRAASVKAVSHCSLWRIDRVTYRRIIMGAQMRKRKLYDSFLEKVPILHTLQKYERLTVADALESAFFSDGEVIIREGEPGETFYIIVEGQVVVYKQVDGVEQEVAMLYSSSYFGEIALLTNRPRAATVRSVGSCKCVKLDRDRFVRVMGPCEDILRRNMVIYNQYLSVNI